MKHKPFDYLKNKENALMFCIPRLGNNPKLNFHFIIQFLEAV